MASLEVCVESIGSACTAKQYGADRLEVCSSLSSGGLTPSLGLVEQVAALWIPFRIMLRPRGGNFSYTEPEMQTIILDVQHFINLKDTAFLEGFVIGFLDEQGRIDLGAAQRIIERVPKKFKFTWHRAIDCCSQPFATAAKSIASNPRIDCILTSGGAREAMEGVENIAAMIKALAGTPTVVMAGCGVNDGTISIIKTRIKEAGAPLHWVHGSCSQKISSGYKLDSDCYVATDANSLCDLKARL